MVLGALCVEKADCLPLVRGKLGTSFRPTGNAVRAKKNILAASSAIALLTMPGLLVPIPDMVCFEVTQDLAPTGAQDIVRWARRHPGEAEIIVTSVFAEFQILRVADARTRSRGRGAQLALKVLNDEIERDPDVEAILLYEDNDIRKRGFVRALPERVTALR